jgi:hypothetical protein
LDSITANTSVLIPEIYGGYKSVLLEKDGEDLYSQVERFWDPNEGDNITVEAGYPTNLKDACHVSVMLTGTQEDSKQGLGDVWETIKIPIERRVIVKKFAASNYDLDKKELTVDANLYDLAEVYSGHLLKDSKGNYYKIVNPPAQDNDNLWKFTIEIEDGKEPSSLSNLRIVSFVDYKLQHRGIIWYYESLSILIQAPSYNKAYWLYLAIAYILQSVKPQLEEAGFQISIFNAAALQRDPSMEPEYVAMRQIDIRWRVQYTFIRGSSLVPDVLKLFIAPVRLGTCEGIVEPTVEQVEEDLLAGKPGQMTVAKFDP